MLSSTESANLQTALRMVRALREVIATEPKTEYMRVYTIPVHLSAIRCYGLHFNWEKDVCKEPLEDIELLDSYLAEAQNILPSPLN